MGYALEQAERTGDAEMPNAAAPPPPAPRPPQPVLLQTLFRIAARAPSLDRDALMGRLCTAIANHYGAITCSIHADQSGWPTASAEPIRAVKRMRALDRARRETMEAQLVQAVFREQKRLSALDLENREDVESFLQRTLGVIDVFAFPMFVADRVAAVLVLMLSLSSDPLAESDLHALRSAGELLALAKPSDDPL
jgi:hypothetical protein